MSDSGDSVANPSASAADHSDGEPTVEDLIESLETLDAVVDDTKWP